MSDAPPCGNPKCDHGWIEAGERTERSGHIGSVIPCATCRPSLFRRWEEGTIQRTGPNADK